MLQKGSDTITMWTLTTYNVFGGKGERGESERGESKVVETCLCTSLVRSDEIGGRKKWRFWR